MADRETFPEKVGDDKPVEFYELEEAKKRFEAGLEAALREKKSMCCTESIGDAIDHGRQDENHRS